MYNLHYNEDSSCFSFGTDQGFRVYNTEPLKERFHRVLEGGISIIEILQKTNICFIVGGGLKPAFPPSKLVVWDDRQNQAVADLDFPSKILDVICRQPYLMVRTENKIYIYDSTNLAEISSFISNYPITDFSSYLDKTVLAFPDKIQGHLRIEHINSPLPTKRIKAHSTKLTQIALSKDGTLVATSSERGTLIRIWNTETCKLEKELRRGLDTADIDNIVFHPDKSALLVSSNKGTIHIFALEYPITTKKNRTSNLSFMKGLLPRYFDSEWSSISFNRPSDRKSSIVFGQTPDTVIIIDTASHYTKYNYIDSKVIESRSL